MRQKIPDKVPAASRNNAAPILGILLERVPLERINLIADKAGNLHFLLLVVGLIGESSQTKSVEENA